MKFYFDTSDIPAAAAELGVAKYGQLIGATGMGNRGFEFGIDNNCFKKFDEAAWIKILIRERPNQAKCRFVALPDVVGCSDRTHLLFSYCRKRFQSALSGYPQAFVCQDGETPDTVPWMFIKAVFIGGTDDFKLSQDVRLIIRCAKFKKKWVHIGRVNSRERFDRFDAMGADSCDGSGLARFTWQRDKFAHPQFEQMGASEGISTLTMPIKKA